VIPEAMDVQQPQVSDAQQDNKQDISLSLSLLSLCRISNDCDAGIEDEEEEEDEESGVFG